MAQLFGDHRPFSWGRLPVPISHLSGTASWHSPAKLSSHLWLDHRLFFFGETLTILQVTGIALALAGIAWVVAAHEEPPDTPHGHTRRGVIFGMLARLGQAMGLVVSKQGMFGEFSPFQANAIRMLAAVIFIWIWTAFEGKVSATFTVVREKPKVVGLLALGALVEPVLGVSASLLAVQHAEIGVASTLMACTKSHTLFC